MNAPRTRGDSPINSVIVGVAIAFGFVAVLLIALLFVGLFFFAWTGDEASSTEPVSQPPATVVSGD